MQFLFSVTAIFYLYYSEQICSRQFTQFVKADQIITFLCWPEILFLHYTTQQHRLISSMNYFLSKSYYSHRSSVPNCINLYISFKAFGTAHSGLTCSLIISDTQCLTLSTKCSTQCTPAIATVKLTGPISEVNIKMYTFSQSARSARYAAMAIMRSDRFHSTLIVHKPPPNSVVLVQEIASVQATG